MGFVGERLPGPRWGEEGEPPGALCDTANLREHFIPGRGPERIERPGIYEPSKDFLQLGFEPAQAEERDRAVELGEEVDVAVGVRVAAGEGAEEEQAAHAELGVEVAEAG